MKIKRIKSGCFCLMLSILFCGCGRAYQERYVKEGILPCLNDLYEDNFSVGISLTRSDISLKEKQRLIVSQFSSVTCGNEMKAESVLNREKTIRYGEKDYPVVDMTSAEPLLKFASENGLKMRGHTLVWYQQTPRWLFAEEFSDDPDAPLVSKERMLKRMENYIQQEMEYCNENYPGVISCWDVVNEAVDPDSEDGNHLRTEANYWYEVIGKDYIEKAFEYARKYADPKQKLFYNDYNCYEKEKLSAIYHLAEGLKEKGFIDGIGMQSHIKMAVPTIQDYEAAIHTLGELGLEIQITELDISQRDNSQEAQQELALRYKAVFQMYKKIDDGGTADITGVTIWGLTDGGSWLNDGRDANYPLLFDDELNPKPSYFGAALDEDIGDSQ